MAHRLLADLHFPEELVVNTSLSKAAAFIPSLDRLLKELTLEDGPEEAADGPLAGKTFVITGSVTHFANRKALQERIEALGGKATGSVTSKTSYLINNDVTSNSAKNKKARELGIPILSEEDFLKMTEEDDHAH